MTETDVISPGADSSADPGPGPAANGGERRRRGGVSGMVLAELRELAGTLGIATSGLRRNDLIAEIRRRQGELTGGAAQLPLGDEGDAAGTPSDGAGTRATTEPSGDGAADAGPARTTRRRASRRTPVAVPEDAGESGGSTAGPGSTAGSIAEAVTAATDALPASAAAAVNAPAAPDDAVETAGPSTDAPSGSGPATADTGTDGAPSRRGRRGARRDAGAPPAGSRSTDAEDGPTPGTADEPSPAAQVPTEQPPGEPAPAEQPPAEQPSGEQPPGEQGGGRSRGPDQQGSDEQGGRPRRERQRGQDQRGQDQRGQDQRGQDQRGQDQRGSDQRGDDRRGDDQQPGRDQRDDRRPAGHQQQPTAARDNAPRDDDEDEEGGGRRRGRRFRDRRRNRNDRAPGGAPTQDVEVRDDDVLVPVAGILDLLDNYAFVRTSGYTSGPNDVYVSLSMVRRYGLRRGDAITGQVKQQREDPQQGGGGNNRQKFNPLVRVDSVNGLDPEQAKKRPEFTKLTPLYPNERLRLETDSHLLTTRVIDLVMPVGKGQRALIVSPPKAGKTTIMQSIANAITTNNPEVHLMVVLVDERPEEVTDMQRTVKGEVIASTFDRPPSDHTSLSELAIERAKRLVEQGHDVVVLLDNITRLGRAYNLAAPASGRILSGGVDSTALYPPKRFLGAARNIEEGGSLTIFATALVETGSTMDTVIFEEFKGTGNAELRLDRKIADKRVFPAIDIGDSGTRKEELLMSPDEHAVTVKLRRVLSALDDQSAIDLVLDRLRKTRTNIEFLMQVAKNAPGQGGED